MARVLVAGAGYVGGALAERLAADEHEVWALRRNPERLGGEVHSIKGDLCDASTLGGLPEGLDYVFYTAGAAGFDEGSYRAAYVDGVRNLLGALTNRDQRLTRVLFTSTTGVYAQMDGGWVDEASPTTPEGFSGKTVLEGEGLFSDSAFDCVSLRLGGIYGPGRTGLIDRVRGGEAVLEERDRYLNLIHRDDAVGALVHLMGLESPESVYVGVDSDPQDWNGLVRWIVGELRLPEPGFSTDESGRRPYRNWRCSNGRLLGVGYVFKYGSCREGYRGLLSG